MKVKRREQELYGELYDASYPGLEYDWIRVCQRFKNTFGFDFAGKSFDDVLSEFKTRDLPSLMMDTINALRDRKELSAQTVTVETLHRYSATLRRDLDEYGDGEVKHLMTAHHNNQLVKIEISIFAADDAPNELSCVIGVPSDNLTGEKVIYCEPNGERIIFVRKNDQYNFSPAFARNDANDLLGLVLQYPTRT